MEFSNRDLIVSSRIWVGMPPVYSQLGSDSRQRIAPAVGSASPTPRRRGESGRP